MQTVHINERGDKGLDRVAYATPEEAETWGRQNQPAGETWTVRTFVELEGAIEAIDGWEESNPLSCGYLFGKDPEDILREAVSDG